MTEPKKPFDFALMDWIQKELIRRWVKHLSEGNYKAIDCLDKNGDIKRRIVIDHEAEWKSKHKIAMDESAKKLWPDTYDKT